MSDLNCKIHDRFGSWQFSGRQWVPVANDKIRLVGVTTNLLTGVIHNELNASVRDEE